MPTTSTSCKIAVDEAWRRRLATGAVVAISAGLGVACGAASQQQSPRPLPVSPPATADLAPEPAADDELEVEGLLGTLEPADAQPVVARSFGEIEACHARASGTQRYVGGRLELRFRVGDDGRVARVRVERSDLGSWPVERCILDVARRLVFPRPRGGEAELVFPVEFPGRAPVTRADGERAQAELAEHLAALAACSAPGGLPGDVLVTAYVGVGGAIKSVGFAAEGGDLDGSWADCALAKSLGWTLSDPRGRMLKVQGWYRP